MKDGKHGEDVGHPDVGVRRLDGARLPRSFGVRTFPRSGRKVDLRTDLPRPRRLQRRQKKKIFFGQLNIWNSKMYNMSVRGDKNRTPALIYQWGAIIFGDFLDSPTLTPAPSP